MSSASHFRFPFWPSHSVISLLTCKSCSIRTTRCKVPLEWNASTRTESFSDLSHAQFSRAPIPLGISMYQQRSALGGKCNLRSLSLRTARTNSNHCWRMLQILIRFLLRAVVVNEVCVCFVSKRNKREIHISPTSLLFDYEMPCMFNSIRAGRKASERLATT